MTCKKKYFYNAANIGFRINQIYLNNDDNTFTLNFPTFFLAWADGNRPPRDIPIANIAAQALYRENMEFLAQQFAAANCNPGVQQGAVTYAENPIVPGYSNYLKDFLGDPTAPGGSFTPDNNSVGILNTQAFLISLGLVSSFWNEENTIASTTQWRDLLQFARRIEQQTDLRMWLPPGIYAVDPAINPPNLAALIADVGNFPDSISIIGIELKSIE